MGTLIFERRGKETKMYATAVTYSNGVATVSTYPNAPEADVRNNRYDKLRGYEEHLIEIPLSRVVMFRK